MAPTVAINVLATVITSSPWPMFKDFNDKVNASVPLLVPIAYFIPINLANFFSNFSTYGPSVNCPDLTSSSKSLKKGL